ncbi:hypothetical protein EDB87DRAFT_1687600 [Lactarius vividus]|nr:hypothetical protein EDB87DRAFT_1687600 [Lactarius vividus]
MLHLIPSLESLVIVFLLDEDSPWNGSFSYRDSLTASLQIDDLFAYFDNLCAPAPFQRIVASLLDLRCLVQDTDYKSDLDHFPAEDFWPDVMWRRILRPAMNLESFSVSCDLKFRSLIRLDLSSVTFPRLTSLSLSNFVWDDVRHYPQVVVPEAEGFIVRHGNSLKKLELQSCIICVPHDRSTLVRSWATVWSRFAEELSKLVDLVVGYNFHRRYAYFQPEYGFGSDTIYLYGTEKDTPALEAFFTIVKGRKGLITTSD